MYQVGAGQIRIRQIRPVQHCPVIAHLPGLPSSLLASLADAMAWASCLE